MEIWLPLELIVALVAIIPYHPLLIRGQELVYDDLPIAQMIDNLATEHQRIGLKLFSVGPYRWLERLTWYWQLKIFGKVRQTWLAVNVLLHVIISLEVLWIAMSVDLTTTGSLLAGCLFAAHPMHVTSVVPIVSRGNQLVTLFMLGLVLGFLHQSYLLMAVCAAGSVGSNEAGLGVIGLTILLMIGALWHSIS